MENTQEGPVGLSHEEIGRYGRQLVLDEVGAEGQLRLRRARVLVVGAGGLGCGLLPHLVAAGVGTVGVADPDRVEPSNLPRQVLYGERDVGRLKCECALEQLGRLSSACRLVAHPERLERESAARLVRQYTLVADCTDSVAARYALSDACVAAGVRLVACSALGWQGQLSVYCAPGGPCYRCVHPAPPPAAARGSCADSGVLGAVVGAMGALQALEVLKVILPCW
jgi:molybdopterin/thiamine biosynthesis adenylyltransferase